MVGNGRWAAGQVNFFSNCSDCGLTQNRHVLAFWLLSKFRNGTVEKNVSQRWPGSPRRRSRLTICATVCWGVSKPGFEVRRESSVHASLRSPLPWSR